MSMHEYEDLVEVSIRTLARSQCHSRNELRALYWNLYRFQDLWGTGFTQLRVLELLLDAHYTYRFDLSEHPDYKRFPMLFQHIQGFCFINTYPEQQEGRQENPVAGYCKPPYLYCDVNSELWQRFVQLGVLTGEDALPVERQDPLDVARVVIETALHEENYELIAYWYYLISPYPGLADNAERFHAHPSLLRIKELFYRTEAHNVAMSSSFLGMYYGAKPEELVDEDGNSLSTLIWRYQAL